MSILKDNHIYSFSQLTNFYNCPYAFYLDKVEHESQVSNIFAEQGTLIHDLIDQWAKGQIEAEDLADEYCKRYPNEVITSAPKMLARIGYEDKAFNLGLDYFKNFDCFAGFEIVDTEKKFRTDIEGRPFVGVVDMVCKDQKTGEWIILDHKSKSLKAFKDAEDEMYKQQYMYSKFFFEKYGFFPDRLVFNLFKEGGLKQERPFKIEEYNETLKWATECIEKIESFDAMDFITECKEKTKKECFFCENLCGVREHCPNGDPANKPVDAEPKTKKGKKKK